MMDTINMTEPNKAPFTILLAEDDPADAMLAKRALKSWGCQTEVFHVLDGLEALRFLRREAPSYQDAPRPQLVLLDLNMPRLGGREALQAIKADENLKGIPIVVLTTSDFEQDVAGSYALGANSYITKPLDLDQFIKVMHTLETYWFNVVTLPR